MARIRTVVLEGDPTQIGLAHGRALAGEIRRLAEHARRYVIRRVGPVRGHGLQMVALAFALAMNRHIPPHLRQEMKGIAWGSGVDYLDLLLINTLDDVLNILRRLAPRAPSLACSSFALFGVRCGDGGLMHGRNLDYHFRNTPLDDGGQVARLMLRETVLFVYRPVGRAAFAAIGWPGMVGITTALNQQGISLGNLTSYLRGTTPNGTPTGIIYRLAMEEASTLGEVGALLHHSRRTIGNNLMVGSGRENRATLFEITRDSVVEVAPNSGLVVATNHFVSPTLAERQRPHLLPHSSARWKRLLALCDCHGVEVREALAFLGDEKDGEMENGGGPFARVANEGTAVSVLFRPAEMVLWIGRGVEPPASRGEFVPIDAGALLEENRGL
ncbi:MAG: C45 family autoproteolytic acyltransferase/hydrolase [Chloroflexota bacterium]